MRLDSLANRLLGHQADKLVDLLTVDVNAHIGDATHAKLGGSLLVGVDVHFAQQNLAAVILNDGFEDGAEALAGTTPVGVKINHHHVAGNLGELFEFGIGDVADGWLRLPASGPRCRLTRIGTIHRAGRGLTSRFLDLLV